MSTGAWIAIAAVVLAVAFGVVRALTDGRFRGTRAVSARPAEDRAPDDQGDQSGPEPTGTTWATVAASTAVAPGERATLVQFSSAFCAPCRATRRVLSDVADAVPGVVHVELDAEENLALVRELGVLRTPTTLILDGAGREIARAAGAPRKEQVLGALPGA